MRVGFAQADITPALPITLSGFVARMNQPAVGVDDPLFVRALALEPEAGEPLLLLVFDLLGLGPELTTRTTSAVAAASGLAGERVWLVCTHTHSAPATVHLQGCGIPSPAYWEQVVAAAAQAGAEAWRSRRGPARLEWEIRHVPGVSYCRRKVLADGRVVMAVHPDGQVVREGEVDDTLFLGRFVHTGSAIAGVAHFAAHADTVCGDRVTADYPGALCAELSAEFRAPFLFLPGAGGDINPIFQEMTRPEMLTNVARMMEHVRAGRPIAAGEEQGPIRTAGASVPLTYQPLPSEQALRAEIASLERLADAEAEPGALANLLNVQPGDTVNASRARFTAQAMADSRRAALRAITAVPLSLPPHLPTSLELRSLRLGSLAFPLLAAEVFTDTARALSRAFPNLTLRTVGYGSPLCGYLPTAQAREEGGYEAAEAYVFYGHPAAYATDLASSVFARTRELIGKCYA